MFQNLMTSTFYVINQFIVAWIFFFEKIREVAFELNVRVERWVFAQIRTKIKFAKQIYFDTNLKYQINGNLVNSFGEET